MIKNIIIGIMVIMCCCIMCFAAENRYEIEADLNENIYSGREEIVGNFLIKKLEPQSSIIILNECRNLTIDNYDKISWRGDKEYIELSNGLNIIKNIEKLIISNENLSYECNNNTYNITVEPLPSLNLNITQNYIGGIDFSYSKNNVNINNDVVSFLTLDVDDDVEVTNYSVDFMFSNGKKIEHVFRVVENKSYEIINNTLQNNMVINSGEIKQLGKLVLKNTGNMNYDLNLSIDGDGKDLVSFPQSQTLFKKSISTYPFNVAVPSVYEVGSYTVQLYINDKNIDNVSIYVKDNSTPTIESIEFEKEVAFLDNTISVIAKDNLQVDKVEINYDNKTYMMDQDNQLFTHTDKFDVKVYDFKVCVYDTVKNSKCREFEKEMNYLNPINNYTRNVNFPSIRVNALDTKYLLNLSEDVNISVNIINFFSKDNNITDYEINLVNEDNDKEEFTEFNNYSLKLYKGKNYLELKGSEYDEFQFDLKFNYSSYIKTINSIRVEGKILNYTITSPFVLNWNGVKDGFNCKNIDTGVYETSYKECTAKYPVDITAQDISIPTTVKERQKFDNDVDELNEDYNNELDFYRSIMMVSFGGLIVVVALAYFMIYIYPYTRFKLGKTDTDEDN